ncbi:MAG: glycosyltransferase [Geitlerinemataceae cyanobacterium]
MLSTAIMSSTASSHPTHTDLLDSFEGKRVIVYAGTLESYQGIDILVGAFKSVVEACPDTILLIVGGTEAQVKDYSSLADQCGISSCSIFTGRVPQSVAKSYASRADVQISSRVSGTNTPLKVYEQLSRPIPLVATNIYSHTQVLNDDVAFLVEPQPQDMARGIIAALDPNGAGQQKAANAQRLYEEKYSRTVYTDKMKNLLDYVLGSQSEKAGELWVEGTTSAS